MMHSGVLKPTRVALIGDASIADYCLVRLLKAGFEVVACVPGSDAFAARARSHGVPVLACGEDLQQLLEVPCDWILSVVNQRIISDALLAHPLRGAINFHDGPLPRYAGLYAPTRALLDGQPEHGVTWHLMDQGVDTGDVLVTEHVPIEPGDTSLDLQLRCLEAGAASFDRLLPMLQQERIYGRPQDRGERTVFGHQNWARDGIETDWLAPREAVGRAVRGHFFGPHENHVGRPRFRVDGQWHALIEAEACGDDDCSNAAAHPGAACISNDGRLHVRCGDGCLVVNRSEPPVESTHAASVEVWTSAQIGAAESWDRALFRHEKTWRHRLMELRASSSPARPRAVASVVLGEADEDLAYGLLAHQGMHGLDAVEFALGWRRQELERELCADVSPAVLELLHPVAPVRFSVTPDATIRDAVRGISQAIENARALGPFLRDLIERDASSPGALPDPAALPVQVFDEPGGGTSDAEWVFTRNRRGAWSVAGPQDEMEFFADLVEHRRQIATTGPSSHVAQLPRLAGATESRLRGWEGTTSIKRPPSFLETVMARLRAADDRAVCVDSLIDGGASDAQMSTMVAGWMEALISEGVSVGDLVPVQMDRSTAFIATMIAVLGVGATFVPMDPLAPSSRLRRMLEMLDAEVGITDSMAPSPGGGVRWLTSPATSAAPADTLARASTTTSDQVAFVLFTSGSTGQPKAIRLTHQNFDQYFDTVSDDIDPAACARSAWTSSVAFDSSVAEVLYPLMFGGAVVPFEPSDLASMPAFLDACRQKAITGLGCATALWSAWMKFAPSLPDPIPAAIRHVDIGGSAAPSQHIHTWLELARPGQRLVNRYGPTETTVTVTAHEVTQRSMSAGELPIGRPERGTEIRILDGSGRRVPPGHVGELWVGGGQVALGYLGQPTPNEWFQPPPGAHGRWYRTGDRATWSVDGEILFRGRCDEQVKVGGYRVELDEVRVAITANAGGRDFEVLVLSADTGHELVVAYARRSSGDGDPDEIDAQSWAIKCERALESCLPRYAVPRRWQPFDALPRTPSGKVDRAAVIAIAQSASDQLQNEHAPGTRPWLLAEVERALGGRRVDTSRSFFELGGDSLAAMGLHAALESAAGRRLPITLVHVARDIDDLARRYEDAAGAVERRPSAAGHRLEVINEHGDAPEVMFMPGLLGAASLTRLWAPLASGLTISTIDLDLDRCLKSMGPEDEGAGFDDLLVELTDLVLARSYKAPPVMVGFSIGGWIAFGIARECLRRGVSLPPPVLMEPAFHVNLPRLSRARQRVRVAVDSLVNLDPIKRQLEASKRRDQQGVDLEAEDPRRPLLTEEERLFRQTLSEGLSRHRPEAANVAARLVTRRTRRLRFGGWWGLVRGGLVHEAVDFRAHTNFVQAGSEEILVDLIRRHLGALAGR